MPSSDNTTGSKWSWFKRNAATDTTGSDSTGTSAGQTGPTGKRDTEGHQTPDVSFSRTAASGVLVFFPPIKTTETVKEVPDDQGEETTASSQPSSTAASSQYTAATAVQSKDSSGDAK